MIRGIRAAGRLLRCLLHILHGLGVIWLRFPAIDVPARRVFIKWWASKTLRLLGIELQLEGAPAAGGALLVANHVSWLDIMAVHAVCPRARFVSKAVVKSWPLVSGLADAAGTLYLERERKRDALRVVHTVAQALQAGDLVAVFPEGTTSDGHVLLPFHANLLQAAIVTETPVQALALRFSDSSHAVSRAVEYIGDTSLVESLWRIARGHGIVVRVVLLAPRASAKWGRRELAQVLRGDIEGALGRG